MKWKINFGQGPKQAASKHPPVTEATLPCNAQDAAYAAFDAADRAVLRSKRCA